MSLTFEFPQWQLRVASTRQSDSTGDGLPAEGREGLDNTNWAADLEDLDSDSDDHKAPDDGQPLGGAPGEADAHASFGGGSPGLHVGAMQGPTAGPLLPCPSSATAAPQPLSDRISELSAPTQQRPSAPGPRLAPAAAVSGDSIPSEVLLLVLSGLRDVGDCVRAALVCKHWLAVVTMSNELWFELHSLHLTEGRWHRHPHAGRPLLRPPPGCDHPGSLMLGFKTTCALTQAAVRFMAMRKGFEYVVEAAAALWQAAQQAAQQAAAGVRNGAEAPGVAQAAPQEQQRQRHQPTCNSTVGSPGPGPGPGPPAAAAATALACSGGDRGLLDASGASGAETCGGEVAWPASSSAAAEATAAGPASPATSASGAGGCSVSGSGAGAGSPSGGGGGGGGGKPRGRITHVDQLWESCGRSRTALQVDARFNAVKVGQMVAKLCGGGGPQWLPLYEGVAAVMASRADQVRDALMAAAAEAARAAPHTRAGPSTSTAAATAGSSGGGGQAAADAATGGHGPRAGAGAGCRRPPLRGDVVYGGGSYADVFAELLRRGDTRGALALAAAEQRRGTSGGGACGGGDGGGGGGGGGGGSGGVDGGGPLAGELDEPEMREISEQVDAAADGDAAAAQAVVASLPAAVVEGLLLWRELLRAWAVYRRWLEVFVVWCGPLGSRVEAERQLAGGAAGPGEAPLAPPHLTNKGLLLFRSQVLLAYPLRRPLQAAALWLSARAEAVSAAAAAGGGGGGGAECGGGALLGGDSADPAVALALSEDEGQLLRSVRKVLTEVAVPDDATLPAGEATRAKLQRCFGRLLLRPVPGGTRALAAAQRMQAAVGGGGGSGGRRARSGRD